MCCKYFYSGKFQTSNSGDQRVICNCKKHMFKKIIMISLLAQNMLNDPLKAMSTSVACFTLLKVNKMLFCSILSTSIVLRS